MDVHMTTSAARASILTKTNLQRLSVVFVFAALGVCILIAISNHEKYRLAMQYNNNKAPISLDLRLLRSDHDEFAALTPEQKFLVCGDVREGGLGSTMQRYIAVFLMALDTNRLYAHPASLRDIEWQKGQSAVIDAFFNLGYDEVSAADLPPSMVEGTDAENAVKYVDQHTDVMDRYRHVLVRKYASAAKPATREFLRDAINVAVHIRRGYGVDPNDGMRITHVAKTATRIRALIDAVAQRTNIAANIHIYSSGDVRDFPEFNGMPVTLHLDGDQFEAFHAMVSADVLVTAHSSFSHVASMFSTGLIIYDPFWHGAPPSVVVARDDGTLPFDEPTNIIKLRRIIRRVINRA